MLSDELNEKLTRVGDLLRRYWHPVAASSEE